MTPGRALSIAALCFAVLAPPALAEGGRFYGMLRSRDLTPFGFLRLDMRPAHAVSIEPHTFAFEAELGYQNTWALSDNVEKYFTQLESEGRREIGPAEVQAIRDLPGENYLFDWSRRRSTSRCTTRSRASGPRTPSPPRCRIRAASWTRPSKDSTTSSGFSTFGRPRGRRATTPTSSTTSRAAQAVLLERAAAPTDSWIRRSACATPASTCRSTGEMSVETAVKVPLDGERLLLSTGRTDYGMQASVRTAGRTQRVPHGLRRRVLRGRTMCRRSTRRRSFRRSSSAGSGSSRDAPT